MEEKITKEQKVLNPIIIFNNYPNKQRVLTAEKISEEYGINVTKVRLMFQDPNLPVQSYMKPQIVLQSEFDKYLSNRHDYLSNDEKRKEVINHARDINNRQ